MYPVTGSLAGVSLRELLRGGRILGSRDIRVRSCSSDWQQIEPGDVFVAIDTPQRDGHQDVEQAIAQGAVAVVAERMLPTDVPTCIVEDTREAFALLCQALAGHPAQRLKMIGVTGSYGKSITAHLIQSIFVAAGDQAGLLTSSVCFDGDQVRRVAEDGATSPEVAVALAAMVANGMKTAVVELSSKTLAQRQWSGIEFDSAIITNLRCDHLDFHGNQENYHQAMMRLVDQVGGDGLVVYDNDDRTCRDLMETVELPALSISLDDGGEINAYLIDRSVSEQTFLLHAGDESITIRTPMVGDATMRCTLLAAAVGLAHGIDLPTIAKGIEQVGHIPGRLERIECGQEFGVFVDFARHPDQIREVLRTLRQVTRGKLTCVFGAKHDRSRQERPLMGRAVERYADRAIITSDNPDYETVLESAHDLMDGMQRPELAHILPDRAAAIRYAIETAEPGDTVVIIGKGDEGFQRVGGAQWAFDDRDVCRQVLYGEHADTSHDTCDDEPIIFPIDDYRRM